MLKEKHHSITSHNEECLKENIENIVSPVLLTGLRRTMNT